MIGQEISTRKSSRAPIGQDVPGHLVRAGPEGGVTSPGVAC